MQNIAAYFNISVSTIHRIIHHLLKIFHAYLVPKYIKWHSMPTWRNLAGVYKEWPWVVALLDCTPFRISKPRGKFSCSNEIDLCQFKIVYLQYFFRCYSEHILQGQSTLFFFELACDC